MSTGRSVSLSEPLHLVLMGVSGCGKSTIGTALARHIGLTYLDGDDLHPARNVEKMRQGLPLDDADRWPWLDRCGDALKSAPSGLVLGCSALRRCYRDRLRQASRLPDLLFVHLTGSEELLRRRVSGRQHPYMPASLLRSQLATLEPPQPDERAISMEIGQPADVMVAKIVDAVRGAGHQSGDAETVQDNQ